MSVNDWQLFVLLNSFCVIYISLIVDRDITCVTYIFSSSYKQFFRLLFYKWIATFWHLHKCILLNCNIPPHRDCVAHKLFVSFKTSLVVDFIITCVTFNLFFSRFYLNNRFFEALKAATNLLHLLPSSVQVSVSAGLRWSLILILPHPPTHRHPQPG